MFSHVMVGSNDIARSKKFYDALFVAMWAFYYMPMPEPA
jgi:catechol 2,3-dioxygenase-like lactoylglutathione lyase family enzyme